MAGATREHNLTAGNIFAELHLALRDRPCEVYSADMRIKVESTGRYVYADASVVCGRPDFDDQARDTLHPGGGWQQNVRASTPLTSPSASPPLGSQVPG